MSGNTLFTFASRIYDIFVNFVEMEPMTLGSPVGSQASPGFTSPYLPEFLMGDSTPGVSWNVNKFLRILPVCS
jgi:hypothetical protein